MTENARAGVPRRSAQDRAFRWLKKHVASLPRHDTVFLTEAEVCESTGLSRTPVREALLRLEAEGLLRIIPKKGAYVPAILDSEVEAVMEARALVEDWCVRRVAPFADSVSADLTAMIDQQKDLQSEPVEFIECDREFHRLIVRAAGNAVLADFYESLRDRQIRMGLGAIANSTRRSTQVIREHAAIVDGLRSGEPETAAAAVTAHLAGTLDALHLPEVSHARFDPKEA